MKLAKISILALTTLLSLGAFAQPDAKKIKALEKNDVVIFEDSIFFKAKAVASIQTVKIAGILKEYSIFDLSGTEVIYASQQKENPESESSAVFIQFHFIKSDTKAAYKATIMGLNYSKLVAEALYENRLLVNGELSEDNVKSFIAKNPMPKAKSTDTRYDLVERKRDGLLQVKGNDIFQEFKKIGTIKKREEYKREGSIYVVDFFLADGSPIATAQYAVDERNRNGFKVTTFKDNAKNEKGISMKFRAIEEICYFLIDGKYL